MQLVKVAALISFVGKTYAANSFLRAGRVSQSDAEASLESEMALEAVNESRLARLQDSLRTTFAALPKDADGNLGHQAVRYVLHRMFIQRHGWYIKGMEPNSDYHQLKSRAEKEWVPSFLQEHMEEKLGTKGASLRDLSAFAAALEDLVRKEAKGRLETAFAMHGFPIDRPIDAEMANAIVGTFYVAYLVSGNFSAGSATEVEKKKNLFAKKYTGWQQAEEWLEETMDPHYKAKEAFDFAAVQDMVNDIGEKYHQFNDVECRALKTELLGMEGRKPGRVRLSQFYKKGLYTHWRFDEKLDYLRTLGALDDSDPDQAQVILPNYLMARTNCLEASSIYALCCRNECEDLMGHLEQHLGAPEAKPGKIAELVAALPSDTVQASAAAPRNLSAALLGRLDQVAANHGGMVPLHGRLFAQWMHHAYPRECPYPHEAGTTEAATADEWMSETGHSTAKASRDEMLQQVESDTCSADAPHDCGGQEIPWSESEELLNGAWAPQPPSSPPRMVTQEQQEPGRSGAASASAPEATASAPSAANTAWPSLLRAFAGACALGLGLLLAADAKMRASSSSSGSRPRGILDGEASGASQALLPLLNPQWRAGLLCAALGCAGFALDLVDEGVFLLVMVIGLLVVVYRRFYLERVCLTTKCKCAV